MTTFPLTPAVSASAVTAPTVSISARARLWMLSGLLAVLGLAALPVAYNLASSAPHGYWSQLLAAALGLVYGALFVAGTVGHWWRDGVASNRAPWAILAGLAVLPFAAGALAGYNLAITSCVILAVGALMRLVAAAPRQASDDS